MNRELIEKYLGISMDWPKNNGLHLPDDFDPTLKTILLVHGLESNPGEFRRLDGRDGALPRLLRRGPQDQQFLFE